METLDLSKYAGTYSLAQAKEVSKQMALDILEAEKREAIKKAEAKHGDIWYYTVRKGISPDLRMLTDGQRVCSCDIKGHHILMTPKF